MEQDNRKPNVRCHKCGYEWFTRSTKKFLSCPSCLQKTLNTSRELHPVNTGDASNSKKDRRKA